MNLSDYIKPAVVFKDAFSRPNLRTKRGGRKPDLDMAIKEVIGSIERVFIENVGVKLSPKLHEVVAGITATDGEHKDAKDKDAWESACDDAVEQEIEDFVPHLSANWLGVNLINTDLHVAGRIETFCAKLGAECYKNLVRDKTAAKIMSSAGITAEMVQKELTKHNNQTQEGLTMQEDQDVLDVFSKIAKHIGANHDILAVYDDCDLASDDDELLANGAGARLGITPKDVMYLQILRIQHGMSTKDYIYEGIKAALSGKVAEPAEAPKPRKKKEVAKASTKTPLKVAPEAPPKPEGDGSIPTSVLVSLKATGFSDTDLAITLGVSRSTAVNFVNGKTVCKPSAEQAGQLRAQVVERLNALHEALAVFDGTEAEVYF